ncbi:MAG: TRAP transporter small permease [Hoeflea sp.]|uniref:TRAP transporter small permease n=1 Tax=Hoeflea sp. TaxID=1940281 RepID=UPI003EF0ECB2
MTSRAGKHGLRRALDAIYDAGGVAAAACLLAILLVIVAQMVTRWLNISVPGLSEYAGYLMASASFLAFAHALNRGAHIRVNLFLTALGERRFWGELWCMVIGFAASSYLAWYAVRLVYWSRKLGDLSQGQDATPMWIVQTPMALGAILLAICFADNLVTLILTRRDNIGTDLVDQSHGE